MLRRHHADYDGGAVKCFSQVRARSYTRRDRLARKKLLVDALPHDAFANFLFVSPQPDLVSLLAAQHDRKRRTPGSRANDRDLAHARFAPKRFSVPAQSRRMFSRCLTRMSREASDIRARLVGER